MESVNDINRVDRLRADVEKLREHGMTCADASIARECEREARDLEALIEEEESEREMQSTRVRPSAKP